MLSPFYRTEIDNQCGETIASATIWRKGKKFTAAGALEFESARTQIQTLTNLATGTQDQGATQDNTTDLFLEADIEVVVMVGGTPSGDVVVRLQRSLDGTNWGDARLGDIVKTFTFSGPNTVRDVKPVS